MKLTKDDLVLGLTKLHNDIQKFANECRMSGFQKEYVKLFDAQAIVANLWDDLYKEQNSEIKSSKVYSNSFNEIVQKDFTYKGNRYTWNDSDCVYYNDNGDEDDFFMEIPEGAITSAKKPIKSSHDKETLKKVIRAYLDKMGYKDVEGGVDAVADYILQNEEYYPDYDLHLKVKQWFKETKENYPETLIKASKSVKSSITKEQYFDIVRRHKSTNASTPQFRTEELQAVKDFPVGTKIAFKEDNDWHDVNVIYEKIGDNSWNVKMIINGTEKDSYTLNDDRIRIEVSSMFDSNATPTNYVSGYGFIKNSTQIKSNYDYIHYPSRMFKGARFENPNGVICEIVKVEPENNYVLYKFNDKFPEDTTIDGMISLLKHNGYYPIASNTPGKVIREEEDDVGYTVQLVELDDGRYKVCDNNGTEDICNTYDEARRMFYIYLG